jgi:hypothetical protein
VKRTSVFLFIGVCALTGVVWFWQAGPNGPINEVDPSDGSRTAAFGDSSATDSTSGNTSKVSPFAVKDSSTATSKSSVVSDTLVSLVNDASPLAATLGSEAGRLFAQSIDVTNLGRSGISDADFLQLADALRSDSDLLQQLIDEFRQESDTTRKAVLARLLGEVGGDSVTLTASELIYSGDAASRRIGLDLLQQIQPGNAAARGIASTLLATEIEPTIIIDTLTTLARPGAVDDSSRQYLSDQVAFFADHEDAAVRSVSLNILSRWSKDGQYTEVLRNGLLDVEPVVRESAAYSLVGHDNVSQALIDSLFSLAVDSTENERARRGAILALKGMPIDDTIRQQVNAAELELDTVRR